MAKRLTLKDVQYVKMAPKEYIMELVEQPDWEFDDFAVYVVMDIFLYSCGGKLPADIKILAKRLRISPERLHKSIEKVEHKWKTKSIGREKNANGCKRVALNITHTRVTKELRAALKRMQVSQQKGLAGAEAKKLKYKPSYSTGGTKRSKVKESKETYTDGFWGFWEAYPRKVGKDAAWKAWQAKSPPLELVMATLAREKQSDQWLKDKGQFIPHPTTWLNQGRWQDEEMAKAEPAKSPTKRCLMCGDTATGLYKTSHHCDKDECKKVIMKDALGVK